MMLCMLRYVLFDAVNTFRYELRDVVYVEICVV